MKQISSSLLSSLWLHHEELIALRRVKHRSQIIDSGSARIHNRDSRIIGKDELYQTTARKWSLARLEGLVLAGSLMV